VRRLIREFEVSGRGLHGGADGAVRIGPGARGAGLMVGRDGVCVPLRPSLAADDAVRCTALRLPGGAVSTVEHLLAALAGADVRDARLEFAGAEVPILDGSSQPWLDRLLEHTVDEPPDGRPRAPVGPLCLERGPSRYRVTPATSTLLAVEFVGPRPALGRQVARWDGTAEGFAREIAPARTFAAADELAGLFAQGLARGGSLDCAVVLGPAGPLGGPLRFPDEPARHKLLDLIGDLALLGELPACRIEAQAPSHAANRELARALARGGRG
jgi:UDP-3-O-[3-hydroxymyristoyl] N-acetylglucosamine deacetylase